MSEHKTIAGEAVELWEKLTGQTVNSTSFTFNLGGEQFDLYNANKRIQQALKIADDMTVTLIISQLCRPYADTRSFSFTLTEALDGFDKPEEQIALMRELRNLFERPAINNPHQDFYGYCEGALAHYRGKVATELDERDRQFVRESSGFVGLDAYNAMDKLTRLMLCDGPLGDDVQPKLSRLIFAFDTIEELITHARRIPTGFSLCAIQAEHVSDSYFALVVRNGQRILVLTDKGNYTHPLQESRMRSRNDRYNQRRIDSSRFPYDLLNIEWSDKGRCARKGQSSTELMISDSGIRVLGTLDQLDNWDLLWLHLLIDQCRERYFRQQATEPLLATGSMIRLEHKWLKSAANLPVPIEHALELDVRTSSELNTRFLHSIEPKWAETYNPNVWMEERFADQVPNDCLYLPQGALNHETPLLVHSDKGGHLLSRADTENLPFWEKEKLPTLHLQSLGGTALASRERVVRDAHFLARYNQCEVIERLARDDFESRQLDMKHWWHKAVKKNLPNIIDDLLSLNHERFWIDRDEHKEFLGRKGNAKAIAGVSGSLKLIGDYRSVLVRHRPVRDQYRQVAYFQEHRNEPVLAGTLGLIDYTYGHYRCCIDPEEPAQLLLCLQVKTAIDIMNISGLALEDIPPELHHMGLNIYNGNSILDRLDPLADLQNPWNKLELKFAIPVSLKQFKRHRKAKGLETPKIGEIEAWAETIAEVLFKSRRQPQDSKIEGLE